MQPQKQPLALRALAAGMQKSNESHRRSAGMHGFVVAAPRSVLDLFGYFLGQCQKVTRSAQPSGSSDLRKKLHFPRK